jgi:hypothetical protein
MRQIEQAMCHAVSRGKYFRRGNTEVLVTDKGCEVFLHGNRIARYHRAAHALSVCLCGWNTPTTKSRLNALLHSFGTGARLYTEKFEPKYMVCGESFPMDSTETVIFLCN